MTDLATFLGKKPDLTTSSATDVNKRSVRTDAAESEESGTSGPVSISSSGQEPVSEQEITPPVLAEVPPESAVYDTTPSGIEVMYQAAPKRLYRVRNTFDGDIPPTEWETVPSVTTVLDVLGKNGLVWWGQARGVQGVLDLFALGALTSGYDWDVDRERLVVNAEPGVVEGGYADEKSVVDLLKHHRLTVNHRLEKAADRGTNVHDALEQWGNTGTIPSPDDFPETERGYVEGLVAFLRDVEPEPVRQEVMVGSVQHGFAGRFDLVFEAWESREYTSRCYPKKADKRETLNAGTYLGDLKTSSGTYPSHHAQLAAYELAAVECGYEPTDAQYVIHVTAAGKYELVRSVATAEHFLAIKGAYDALKELP